MEFNATFIVSAISFIAFTLIMNAIFYKPLGKIVSDRQQLLDEHYNEAKEAHETAKSLLSEKEEKLEEAKHSAKKIISEKSESAKLEKNKLAQEAQQNASGVISQAKEELQKSKEEAREVLSNQVVDLAQSISSKILGADSKIENADKNIVNEIMQG